MNSNEMLDAIMAASCTSPPGSSPIKMREQPLRPKVAVVLEGKVYLGNLDEKIAGGLWAVSFPANGGEVLLGIFRMGEILDPITMTPMIAT